MNDRSMQRYDLRSLPGDSPTVDAGLAGEVLRRAGVDNPGPRRDQFRLHNVDRVCVRLEFTVMPLPAGLLRRLQRYGPQPLKSCLDWAQNPDNAGGFWITVELRDGRRLTGTVEDHRYRDEVRLHLMNEDLQQTGEVVDLDGREVVRVDLDGDLADGHAWVRAEP